MPEKQSRESLWLTVCEVGNFTSEVLCPVLCKQLLSVLSVYSCGDLSFLAIWTSRNEIFPSLSSIMNWIDGCCELRSRWNVSSSSSSYGHSTNVSSTYLTHILGHNTADSKVFLFASHLLHAQGYILRSGRRSHYGIATITDSCKPKLCWLQTFSALFLRHAMTSVLILGWWWDE